ncbi:emerin homolog 1-like [Gigantopelta aegis]|uniref:emerin homolog 1-like n=1 Tax=Gigantopelta aegis TaxID=1735272 RepID=UPI001B888849|nr:emerin homolog 1-like [Gigantopelta aegis]
MPPLPREISNFSNKELVEKLRDYGVDVGPITVTTRSVYEKKLMKLLSGVEFESPSKYEPVDDDEESDEDIIETVYTRSTQNPVRQQKTLFGSAYSEPRRRLEREEPSPGRIPRYEAAGDPASNLRPVPRRPMPAATSPVKKKGIPLVVKVSIFVVLLILAFLIVKNMESSAQSNIPQEIEAEV